MALKISTTEVWAATLADEPGGLAGVLEQLARAGVNLQFLIARRTAEKPGRGVVFATPISGKKQTAAARAAGFQPAESVFGVMAEATDASGLGAKVTRALADAKLNLRGFSGAAIGKRAVLHISLDSRDDAKRALRVLKRLK